SGGVTDARNFAGAVAGAAVVSSDASRASVQRTGCRVSTIVERKSRKGGRTCGIRICRAGASPAAATGAVALQAKSRTKNVRADGYWLKFCEGFRRRQLEAKLKWQIQIN